MKDSSGPLGQILSTLPSLKHEDLLAVKSMVDVLLDSTATDVRSLFEFHINVSGFLHRAGYLQPPPLSICKTNAPHIYKSIVAAWAAVSAHAQECRLASRSDMAEYTAVVCSIALGRHKGVTGAALMHKLILQQLKSPGALLASAFPGYPMKALRRAVLGYRRASADRRKSVA